MTTAWLAVFWAAALLLAWVYFGYPLVALAAARLWPVRLVATEPPPRLVTVGIAVHDVANEVDERLRDILAQEVDVPIEVIVASDGSTDATAQIVQQAAGEVGRIRLLELPRAGQSAAQGRIFEAAAGDIVVLTDAETRFAPGSLHALLAPFADPRVGCTTGVLRWQYESATDTARHEGLYWRYEQLVRAWESRAGWLTAATGALLAARRSVYRPVPQHASLDQMLPLLARASGMLVLVAPDATGTDRGSSSPAEQFRSRVRIATQGIGANLRMARAISPWRSPGPALAIWSHKILRWMTPWLVIAAAVAAVALVMLGQTGYWAALLAIGAFFALAALGWLLRRAGKPVALATFPLTVVVVNLAFLLGWLNLLLGRRIGSW